MRIIGGSARSLPLKTVEGYDTRPTTDRIKETLFNILGNDVEDEIFLDLFAGSGSVGLEAISRGAKRAVFVDNSRRAVACIRENIQFTRFDLKCDVICMDFMAALKLMEGQYQFGMIYMDPPYGKGLSQKAMSFLQSSNLCGQDTLIIVEESLDFNPDDLCGNFFRVIREKKYKTNQHIFLKRRA